ncbi:glycoside hydrolase family 9 protein [Mesoaciditoga lauensis]|uniref:glycoside hydrolase family 9 protein n=1 Tax=Mesoaciditoga lauensis TaxID=1495039 RepID=UPI000561711B|nr:glycoside hydrolase family 9 protein [Mesoaciditoga lauensis]
MKKAIIFLLLLTLAGLFFANGIPLVLSHLENLKWDFELNSKNVAAWWVYSKPSLSEPDKYVNTPAKNEGAVCVDDASRAVILFLQLYEETGNKSYLKDAKGGLEFLMAMEENDGEFYNFVYKNGEINKYGVTSRKSVSWWTIRGFWALSMGARVFKKVNADYSSELFDHALAAYKAIKNTLQNGLVLGYSDMSSVFLLGLSETYLVDPTDEIASTAKEVANGILKTQSKNGFTDGMFFVSNNSQHWNGWGARQVQALAMAGRVFKNQEWIRAAEYAALHFYPKLIFSLGPIYAMNGSIILYPQISYANEVMISGLTQLYISTKKEIYADMAYIAASWYFYNNHLKELMYTEDGKGFDGLEEFFRNIDSGAESTICADLSLSDLMELPGNLLIFLKGKRVHQNGIAILNASKMYFGFGGVNVIQDGSVANGSYALLAPYSTISGSVALNDDTYDVYISYLNRFSNGKIDVYLNDKKYEIHPKTTRQFEFAKVLSNARLSKGKNRIVIEYANKSNSAKLAISQIILVPHMMTQTISIDENRRLTSVFNQSNHSVAIDSFINGKFSKAFIYSNDGTLVKTNMIPKNGFAFIEWISTNVLTNETTVIPHFEKTRVASANENFVMIDLSSFFNNAGIVSIHSNKSANFDNPSGNTGAAYPLEFLREKIKNGVFTSKVARMQIPFYMGKLLSNAKDNMTLQGQKLGIKKDNYKELFLLGSSDHGNYIKTVKLYYSDGSSKEVAIGFADWFLKPLTGEWTVFTAPYGINSQMQKINGNPKLYVQRIKLDSSKKLMGIEFPNQITMHIFAITLLR